MKIEACPTSSDALEVLKVRKMKQGTDILRNQGGRGSAVLTPSSLLQLKPFSPRFSTPAGASVALKAGYIFKLAEKSDCGVNITLTTFSQDAGDRRILVGGLAFPARQPPVSG